MKLKKGKGIKKNRDYDKPIFKGEYKNGKKYKGKEYNDYGRLKIEGEDKDGYPFSKLEEF